jgi:hypothetical protein
MIIGEPFPKDYSLSLVSASCKGGGGGSCTEGVFLEVIGTKDLKTFAPCYSQSPPPAYFTPPFGLLGLEFSTGTTESRWGLGFVYIIFLFTFEK